MANPELDPEDSYQKCLRELRGNPGSPQLQWNFMAATVHLAKSGLDKYLEAAAENRKSAADDRRSAAADRANQRRARWTAIVVSILIGIATIINVIVAVRKT